MFAMSTAEKIETVVLSYLQHRTTAGQLGTLVEVEPSRYRVTADGKTLIVSSCVAGWAVSFKGFQGIDRDIMVAARYALDGGSRRDVSTVADALK